MAKDNTGIKGILSIHTPRKEVVVKKPRPSVQELLDQEDLLNIYDPYWQIPGPSDTPEVILKPQETPKNKFGHTKAQKNKMINDYLTRPPDPIKKMVEKNMPILTYVDKMNTLYGGQEKRKYEVTPKNESKPFRYEPWGPEVNVRPESRSQKAEKTNKTTKEKTDEQV